MGAFTRSQPSNSLLESGSTSLLLILLEVINRFHFYERCALRPGTSIPEHIFKNGKTLVKMKNTLNSSLPYRTGASLRGISELKYCLLYNRANG